MIKNNPKFLILGEARSGKDTLCEFLSKMYPSIKYQPTSLIAAKEIIMPAFMETHEYNSDIECFEDRFNYREEWADLINQYNKDNKTKFISKVFETQNIYCGLRNLDQFIEGKRNDLWDLSIYVDSSLRIDSVDKTMLIPKSHADIIIDNNYGINSFYLKILNLFELILPR